MNWRLPATVLFSRTSAWILAGMVCSAGGLHAAERVEPVKPIITPSPATTNITAPLDAEGYVDYLAALNERLGQGVKSSENAAIPLLEAIGVAEKNLDVTNRIRAALGMAPWAPGAMQMFSMGDLVSERTAKYQDNGVVTDSAAFEAEARRINDQNGPAMERPWKEADFPDMAEVLKRNAASLKVVADAVKRPKYYRPMVKMNPQDTMISMLLPDIQVTREFARQLSMRSMLHLGHGRVAEARADLITMHRLGAHISNGATLIEGLVGVAIDSMAAAGDNRWANHPQVKPADIANYRQELMALPPVSNFAGQLDLAERYMGLDVTQAIARGRITTTAVASSGADDLGTGLKPAERLFESLVGLSVDWPTAMQTLNRQYDAMVAVAKNSDPRARDQGLLALDAQLRASKAESTTVKAVVANVLGGNKGRGKSMGNTLGQLLVPAVMQVFEAENRVRMRRLTTITGFAILEYRAVKGEAPAKLQDLVPEYLPSVPQDVYTGEALKYTTDGTSFRVYAIGKNHLDDGGKTFTSNQPWDDVGFTMPAQQ